MMTLGAIVVAVWAGLAAIGAYYIIMEVLSD